MEAELLKEHSKRQTLRIVDWIGNDPDRFNQLVQVFLKGPYRVTQRAAWPLSYCVEIHPGLITPHLPAIIPLLKLPVHQAVKRNIVRLLQYIHIPGELSGEIVSSCFDLLADKKEPVAIRVFSMTVLFNACKKEPELKKELKLLIEENLPYPSPAFHSRAGKILKSL